MIAGAGDPESSFFGTVVGMAPLASIAALISMIPSSAFEQNDSEGVCNVLTEDTGNAEYALPDLDHRAHKTSMRRCGSGRQLRSQSPLRMDWMIHSFATGNGS